MQTFAWLRGQDGVTRPGPKGGRVTARQEKAYAGVLQSVRRRFEEAGAIPCEVLPHFRPRPSRSGCLIGFGSFESRFQAQPL